MQARKTATWKGSSQQTAQTEMLFSSGSLPHHYQPLPPEPALTFCSGSAARNGGVAHLLGCTQCIPTGAISLVPLSFWWRLLLTVKLWTRANSVCYKNPQGIMWAQTFHWIPLRGKRTIVWVLENHKGHCQVLCGTSWPPRFLSD